MSDIFLEEIKSSKDIRLIDYLTTQMELKISLLLYIVYRSSNLVELTFAMTVTSINFEFNY